MTEASFRRLLLRLACIPLFALGLVFGVLGFQFRQIVQLRSHSQQTTAILLQSSELERLCIDEETGIRGYLAANDPIFLQPYNEAIPRARSVFALLQKAASSDTQLTARLATIAELNKRFAAINQQLLQNRLPNEPKVHLLQQQKQTMDALRVQFSGLNADEDHIRESNRNRLTTLFNRLPGLAASGGLVLSLLVIWYGVKLFQQITLAFHKQFEETALQRDYLQTTLQSIGDGVVVCDDYGKITILNPAAEAITGWKSEDALGRSLPEVMHIIHEHTRVQVENPADKIWRLGVATQLDQPSVLVRRDGSEVPIDDSGAPLRRPDGSLSGVVLVFRSVAEERRAANALRQSQRRLNSIFETSLSYNGVLDPAGTLLECNRASLEFAGNTRDEIVGRSFWECPWFTNTPGMPEAVHAAVKRAAGGQPTRTELDLVRPSGEVVKFDFSLNPVFDPEGRVVYIVPEARDISDLKRAETALIQSEKLAVVGRLATSIAHEINNPLEAVTNLLYLARLQSDPGKADEYLKAADQELRRVSVIANQTLRFHKQSSSPQPIEVEDLLATVLSIYEGKLRNSQVAVEINHRSQMPIVCFAGDVRQVLNNLVGNAIDAMNDAGGRLIIRSRRSTDWATGRKGMTLTVADTGTGIPAAHLQRIFEPFFTTKGIGGTGLGLWVSQEVVARHSGSLNVRSSTSASGSGTVFRLFLPLL